MKLKAVLMGDHNSDTVLAFGSPKFNARFLDEIVNGCFDVEDARERPAEFYVQEPDRARSLSGVGLLGVEVRLTGINRGSRPVGLFHNALKKLVQITRETVSGSISYGKCVQIFCVIMLDGDIETPPGSGNHSSILEGGPLIVTAKVSPE